jgi:hypothetical protein
MTGATATQYRQKLSGQPVKLRENSTAVLEVLRIFFPND